MTQEMTESRLAAIVAYAAGLSDARPPLTSPAKPYHSSEPRSGVLRSPVG